MRRSVILVLAAMGCTFDASGQGQESGSGEAGSTSTAAASGSSTGMVGSGTTGVVDGSGNGSSGSSTRGPGTESGSTGAPPPTARSCAEILADDPTAPTGIHAILRTSDDGVVDVYCDMELDDGGWTLVGRSGPEPIAPFGWGVQWGALGDENGPYSLDTMDVALPFTEILLTRRTGFATPSDNAYVIDVPPGFLEDYRTSAYEHAGARTVLGGCDPGSGGPRMLRWVGHTDDEERFFFRDLSENDSYGLFSYELRTLYDDCWQGGDLNGEQGAVFVR